MRTIKSLSGLGVVLAGLVVVAVSFAGARPGPPRSLPLRRYGGTTAFRIGSITQFCERVPYFSAGPRSADWPERTLRPLWPEQPLGKA